VPTNDAGHDHGGGTNPQVDHGAEVLSADHPAFEGAPPPRAAAAGVAAAAAAADTEPRRASCGKEVRQEGEEEAPSHLLSPVRLPLRCPFLASSSPAAFPSSTPPLFPRPSSTRPEAPTSPELARTSSRTSPSPSSPSLSALSPAVLFVPPAAFRSFRSSRRVPFSLSGCRYFEYSASDLQSLRVVPAPSPADMGNLRSAPFKDGSAKEFVRSFVRSTLSFGSMSLPALRGRQTVCGLRQGAAADTRVRARGVLTGGGRSVCAEASFCSAVNLDHSRGFSEEPLTDCLPACLRSTATAFSEDCACLLARLPACWLAGWLACAPCPSPVPASVGSAWLLFGLEFKSIDSNSNRLIRIRIQIRPGINFLFYSPLPYIEKE